MVSNWLHSIRHNHKILITEGLRFATSEWESTQLEKTSEHNRNVEIAKRS
jgi:hypothetical protein